MKEVDLNSKKRGKYGSVKDKALTPAEVETIYLGLKSNKDRCIFILGAYAGLRVGELVQMRREWLERKKFGEKEVLCVNIPNESRDIKNKYSIWRPKTRRERTTYIFKKELFLEVENYFEHNESLGYSIRGLQAWSYANLGRCIHSLRATAVNYLRYVENFSIEEISVMLGHKNIKTTQNHYKTQNKATTEYVLTQRFK